MVQQFAAHLRFHYRISPKSWKEMDLSDEEVLEWYFEYIFIKEELGEIVRNPKQDNQGIN